MLSSRMGTVEHYRKQAVRCRELVANQPFSKHADRWRALSRNYDTLADGLERRLSANQQRVREIGHSAIAALTSADAVRSESGTIRPD